MSSLDKDAQDKFKGMITSISPGSIHKTINSNEIEKLPGVEWRDLQLNGLLLKKSFEGIIGGIKPDIGKSVIKRLKYFQFWKENHISLYNQLGFLRTSNLKAGEEEGLRFLFTTKTKM